MRKIYITYNPNIHNTFIATRLVITVPIVYIKVESSKKKKVSRKIAFHLNRAFANRKMKATIIILITIVINILVIIVTRFGVIMIQRGFVNVAARYESTISTNAIIHFT